MASLAEIVLRSSVLLAGSAALAYCFRRCRAETRDLIWRAALCGLLLLPPLQSALFLLSSPVAVPVASTALPRIQTIRQSRANEMQVTGIEFHQPNGSSSVWDWLSLGAVAYVAVVIILLARMATGLLQIRKIIRKSEPILDSNLRQAALDAWLQSLSRVRPQVRISADVVVPLAIHAGDAVILLPEACLRWNADKIRAVLLHEMAHVRRNDPAVAALASLAVCLFWVHPLVYWLRRQLSVLSEDAADEATVSLTGATAYARTLMELSAMVSVAGQRLLASCAIAADRSRIKRRLEKIYSIPAYSLSSHRSAQVAVLLIFCPMLFLSAGKGDPQGSRPIAMEAQALVSIAGDERAFALESRLAQYPDDLKARVELMALYANQRNESLFAGHRLWMIEHHPDHPAAAMHIYTSPGTERRSGRPGSGESGVGECAGHS